MNPIEEISFSKKAAEYKDCVSFLLVTATEIEITEALKNLQPLPHEKSNQEDFVFHPLLLGFQS